MHGPSKKLGNLDYWDTLRRVAKLGSMNKAASEMKVDVASVSNKIRVLEENLGFEVLTIDKKSHKSYLTPKGETSLKKLSPLLDQFYYALTEICETKAEYRETLKINVSNGLLGIMTDWLKTFCNQNEGINIELVDNKSIDLGRQLGFDIAIFANYGQRPPGECIDLGAAPTYMVASKNYLKINPIDKPEELIHHRLISCSNWNCEQKYLYGQRSKIPISWGSFFGVDNCTTLVSAVKEGVGIGWGVPSYLCRNELKSGELIRLFAPLESASFNFFLATGSKSENPLQHELLNFILSSWKREFSALKPLAPSYALR